MNDKLMISHLLEMIAKQEILIQQGRELAAAQDLVINAQVDIIEQCTCRHARVQTMLQRCLND